MEKTILPFGHPILRKQAEPIVKFNRDLHRLLDDMTAILYAKEGRAGLAAPQIGVSLRVIVMDCGEGKIELINPVILENEGEQVGPEACLSFLGYTGVVKRANYVKVKNMTRNGHEVILEGEEFLARCIQHEMDHLDGVLFIDHIEDGQLYDDLSGKKVDLDEALRLSKKR
ncbi:MAG TPA: peptide deformylase [Bacillota bacterium]|nr:peptide deformylase [Bacillota bacterium]